MRGGYCILSSLLLVGCGYVGDPLPPALHIPHRVTDLNAVQRGDQIEIRFTTPALTTEELGINHFESMELRIGPLPKEFTLETWAAEARPISAPLPLPGKPVQVNVPAADWTGKEVLIAVRFAGARGRLSDWSNSVTLTPRAGLSPPRIEAALHPEGVRLSWPSGQVRLYRGEDLIATVTGTEYIDKAVELGKTYSYQAQAIESGSESLRSDPVSITVEDKFAPRPPGALTVVAGLDSIELTWEPNTEADLSGYRIYRALGTAEFSVLADAVESPAFSDRTAAATGVHRYRVTAVDRAGNESAASEVVEVSR